MDKPSSTRGAKDYRSAHYPPSLKWAMDDAYLTADPHYVQSIEEYRCSPIRLLEYINREGRARDALDLYDLTDGHTRTANLGSRCGFVKSPVSKSFRDFK